MRGAPPHLPAREAASVPSVTRAGRSHAHRVGAEGEGLARRCLEREGLRVIASNYRCRHGEIDLIAQDGTCVVFCEVKYRMGRTYGLPEEAVTALKQHTIRSVAEDFLTRHHLRDQECRFDVVCILREGNTLTIRHLRNAF